MKSKGDTELRKLVSSIPNLIKKDHAGLKKPKGSTKDMPNNDYWILNKIWQQHYL